jgi:hypothetical protein
VRKILDSRVSHNRYGQATNPKYVSDLRRVSAALAREMLHVQHFGRPCIQGIKKVWILGLTALLAITCAKCGKGAILKAYQSSLAVTSMFLLVAGAVDMGTAGL